MLFLRPGDPIVFPDPRDADEDGLVAIGGDLSPHRLLAAYRLGIFPWYDEDTPPIWWSPDPRAVITAETLHVSRRLARRMRQGRFELSWDRAFDEVLEACAERPGHGTWIIPEMAAAYSRLHRLGHAHSLEVWTDGELTGGIYGVHVGGVFAAESMFHRRTDHSKIALVACVRSLAARGVEVVDTQMSTEHLTSLGIEEWTRERYLDALERLREAPVSVADLTPDWSVPPAEGDRAANGS